MTLRDAKVEIRCTSEEKARWVEAAGGQRRVSDWIRRLANTAAENEPLLHEPVVEATKQSMFEAQGLAAERAKKDLIPPASSVPPVSGNMEKVSIGKTNEVHTRCPREHHHRPGTYCASCKCVPIKPQKRA